MKCPKCQTEGRIQSNKLVRKKDGTLAYKMVIVCRNKNCDNNEKVIHTVYDPVEVIEE
jgi:hypothetical protein